MDNFCQTSVYVSRARERIAADLERERCALRPTAVSPVGLVVDKRGPVTELPKFRQGLFYVEDEAAQLVPLLLDPQPGDLVLDPCAAPGGKSLLIADTMQSGRLVAVDLPPEPGKPATRLERLKENLSRTRGVDVALVQADVMKNIGNMLREHRLPETYDAVLLDVPCSNTGVMRHRVDVKWRLQPGDFKKHPQQQLSLLHAAARLVTIKPRGGELQLRIEPR